MTVDLEMPSVGEKTFLPSSGYPETKGSPNPTRSQELMTAETVTSSKLPDEVVDHAISEHLPDETAQDGVANAEAMTLSWTKTSLGAAYILMFLIYLVNGFQSTITGNISAYVTSNFQSHSELPVITVASSIMSAATYMPVSKILNLWDRSIGFLLMAVFSTLGFILSATCTNIAVYCAAQVFYSIGFGGMIFCVDVITADTSTLRDRGLALAFTSSPYIITAFAGSSAAQHFYESNWRWGYGCFAIVLPVVALPMFGLLQYNRHKAKKKGLLRKKDKSNRTLVQSIIFYVIEFDLLGVFLFTAGLILFLLPFTIAGSTADDWKSGSIISMLVVGIVCLIVFALSEHFLAPVPFLPWELLTSRTVLGACLLDVSYQVSQYCWQNYYTSYLQVVYGTSIEVAGYINHIFDVVSGVWLLVVGLLIRKTGHFRWLLFFAVPLYMLGVGLMIYFRQPHWSVGYSIMCQIFIAFAGGTMIICQQVAVLAAADHNHAASSLAFLNCFGSMGSAIGSSISGAIWTHTLPEALKRRLPESVNGDWKTIYDSLEVQLSYPKGTAVRTAISLAYAESQRSMLIAGTAIMALSLIWTFVIRDIELSKKVQTKGVLF